MELSIICVNWNSLAYLTECIRSIYERTRDIEFEIIVVDNASSDRAIDGLADLFPGVKVIRSSRNLGFAGANNLGFTHAAGKYILFLNPDTRLVSPAINILLRRARSLPRVGVVGCKLLNGDLSVQTSSIMRFPRILNRLFEVEHLRLKWPQLFGIGPLFSDSTEPIPVEAISGACMLLKHDVFTKVGMFSEDYFMYSEDVDLCFKVLRAGFRNYYVGEATVVHYGGKSGRSPKWQTVMKTQAELQFCEKHYRRFYASMFRTSLGFNALARLTLLVVVRAFHKLFQGKDNLSNAWARWIAILQTALSRCADTAAPQPK